MSCRKRENTLFTKEYKYEEEVEQNIIKLQEQALTNDIVIKSPAAPYDNIVCADEWAQATKITAKKILAVIPADCKICSFWHSVYYLMRDFAMVINSC